MKFLARWSSGVTDRAVFSFSWLHTFIMCICNCNISVSQLFNFRKISQFLYFFKPLKWTQHPCCLVGWLVRFTLPLIALDPNLHIVLSDFLYAFMEETVDILLVILGLTMVGVSGMCH